MYVHAPCMCIVPVESKGIGFLDSLDLQLHIVVSHNISVSVVCVCVYLCVSICYV